MLVRCGGHRVRAPVVNGVATAHRGPSPRCVDTEGGGHELLRDAKTVKAKAVAGVRSAFAVYNSFDGQGRVCSLLLLLQYAGEMLLKAALVQGRVRAFA